MPDLPVTSSNENGESCRTKSESKSENPTARIIAAAFVPAWPRHAPSGRAPETRAMPRPPFPFVPGGGTHETTDTARDCTRQHLDGSSTRRTQLPKSAASVKVPDH